MVLAESRQGGCNRGAIRRVDLMFSCPQGLTTGSRSLLAFYDFSLPSDHTGCNVSLDSLAGGGL